MRTAFNFLVTMTTLEQGLVGNAEQVGGSTGGGVSCRARPVFQCARLRLIFSTHFKEIGCAASQEHLNRLVCSIGVYRVICEDQCRHSGGTA